jgi:isopentenyldiphosphate isomerase
MEELLLALDSEGRSLDKYYPRDFVHKCGIFHNEIVFWIINPETQDVLLQRRSPSRQLKPNKIAPCAGHVAGGQTIRQTLFTEVREELGIDAARFEIKPLITLKCDEPWNRCFAHNFYTLAKVPLSKFRMQKEEVSELLYMNYNTLRERMKNNDPEIAVAWNAEYEKLFCKIDEVLTGAPLTPAGPVRPAPAAMSLDI